MKLSVNYIACFAVLVVVLATALAKPAVESEDSALDFKETNSADLLDNETALNAVEDDEDDESVLGVFIVMINIDESRDVLQKNKKKRCITVCEKGKCVRSCYRSSNDESASEDVGESHETEETGEAEETEEEEIEDLSTIIHMDQEFPEELGKKWWKKCIKVCIGSKTCISRNCKQ